MMSHVPVLLNEVIEAFAPVKVEYFLDGTLGAGGHAEAILQAHPEMKCYVGVDQDLQTLSLAKENLVHFREKIQFVHSNFLQMKSIVEKLRLPYLDGILLDLGVSSMQFDIADKGFSFMREGPLDMRMDNTQPLTAEQIVNEWSEGDLGFIFRNFGEEKRWKQAARAIGRARKEKAISTTKELVDILSTALPKSKKGIHPATLIFQALRIAVNDELKVLEEALPAAMNLLKPGGRLAIISFHSLEDRIVKTLFRMAASDKVSTVGIGGVFLDKTPTVKLVTQKPITASEEELKRNPRSRSAKLRIIEKK